jgi:hypothetical protein
MAGCLRASTHVHHCPCRCWRQRRLLQKQYAGWRAGRLECWRAGWLDEAVRSKGEEIGPGMRLQREKSRSVHHRPRDVITTSSEMVVASGCSPPLAVLPVQRRRVRAGESLPSAWRSRPAVRRRSAATLLERPSTSVSFWLSSSSWCLYTPPRACR